MEGMSPDWVKTLVMAELRIETATPQGTFQSAIPVLDHYAEMGVNGLWICPIWGRGSKKNGYGNFGCDTIESELTGTKDLGESYGVVKKFVDEAHSRNIRVIFDFVVWGTRKNSPLVTEHPDFYRHISGGFVQVWGGYGFDWTNASLRQWYREAAVNFIIKTGADGFRVDLAPDVSGYFFNEIRAALYAQGHKVIVMSETQNERKETFDFEENGVDGWTEEPDWKNLIALAARRVRFGNHSDFLLRSNIVDVIQSGTGIGKARLQQEGKGATFRFYTDNLLNHDDDRPFVEGNRVRFGYPAVFAPLLPLWWIGEEWNNPKVLMKNEVNDGVMFFNTISLDLCREGTNRDFYEDTKKFLRIRRSYPEIFDNFPGSTRKANILKVDSIKDGAPNDLQAYARFSDREAVLVVPNYQSKQARSNFEIAPPYDRLKLVLDTPMTITDLMTGSVVQTGLPKDIKTFKTSIKAENLGLYLVRQ